MEQTTVQNVLNETTSLPKEIGLPVKKVNVRKAGVGAGGRIPVLIHDGLPEFWLTAETGDRIYTKLTELIVRWNDANIKLKDFCYQARKIKESLSRLSHTDKEVQIEMTERVLGATIYKMLSELINEQGDVLDELAKKLQIPGRRRQRKK